jgi:FKBP-type peptidyl-prolyl cis-trans isomerase (trigger factor)
VKRKRQKNKDSNEAYNRLKPAAELEVKWFLLKDAIQKQENISVTDEELNELAKKEAEKTGIGVEKLINYYKSSNLAEKIADKKLFNFLKEKNQIKKIELPSKITT